MTSETQGAEGAGTKTDERRQMAEGCCSAVSPCSHQQREPYSLCEICQKANGLAERITSAAPRADSAGQGAARTVEFMCEGQVCTAEVPTPKPAPSSPGVPDSVREALEFYADPKNWRDTPPWDGDPEMITEKAIPVSKEEGSPCDCGDVARAALKTISAHPAGQSTGQGADQAR